MATEMKPINLGDTVRLKKKHACGGDEWQVVRLGTDIGVKCLKCHHYVLLERSLFERRIKARSLLARKGVEGQKAGS
ncbi:MAG: DUF951 domain-containing protein [Chloroflexota bacterium]